MSQLEYLQCRCAHEQKTGIWELDTSDFPGLDAVFFASCPICDLVMVRVIAEKPGAAIEFSHYLKEAIAGLQPQTICRFA